MIRKELKWFLMGIFLVVFSLASYAKEDPKKNSDNKNIGTVLQKTTGTPDFSVLNINDFMIWLRQDGQMNHTPSNGAGGYYPRGTTTVIYEDNIVWGGVAYTDAAKTTKAFSPHGAEALGVRIGGGTYNQGTTPGAIVGTGATAVGEPLTDVALHIYRIRRDYASMVDQEITNDAADIYRVPTSSVTSTMKDDIITQYAADWTNWPVEKGAPYIERNGTPGYQKPPAFSATFTVDSLVSQKCDEPGVAGADPNSPADQVLWSVYNDLNKTLVGGFEGSLPIGIEAQRTVWGYKGTSEIGSIYFTRVRLINKGGGYTVDANTKGQLWLDSVFVCQWSDPDVGDSGDDLAGCDTTLSLGYAYNGQGRDVEFVKFSLAPPAVGYDFLAGPVVASPGDSAIVDLKRVYNKKNLGMSSFAYFSAGSDISDPNFDAEGGQQWWRMLRGYVPDATGQSIRYYPFPSDVPASQFPLSGDPTTGQGFLDGQGTAYSLQLGDRRLLLNTGPFQLAAGDTQEVYVGTVAGLAADRFSSITKMKLNDRAVQNTFDALFKVPKNPERPTVNYVELNGNVVFEWGSDTAQIQRGESAISNPGDFQFEGYRVYQLPAAGSRLSDGKIIASYDVKNIYGDNTGVAHYFKFDQDYIKDIPKLNNGQVYYVAVTAYMVTHVAGYVPAQLESSPITFRVIPQGPKIGTTVGSKNGDLIKVTRTATEANGAISVKVIDPSKLTGDTYEIQIKAFDSVDVDLGGVVTRAGNHVFQLVDVTQNKVVLGWNNKYGVNDNNPIIDGFQFGFNVPPFYVAGSEIAEVVTPPNMTGVNWGGSQMGGGLDVGWNFFDSSLMPWEVTKSVEIRFNSVVGQKAYDFVHPSGSSLASPFKQLSDQPFTVWDVSDPAHEIQIDFAFMEDLASSTNNGIWDPGATSSAREYFFIMGTPYTGNNDYNLTTTSTLGSMLAAQPCLYAGWPVRVSAASPAYENGDVFRIVAAVPSTSASRWQFSTAPYKISFEAAKAKTDVNKINVWPNPYYANNPSEISRFNRFVTFNGLPVQATIRIFNLAGQQVRIIEKNDPSQFIQWDLTNSNRLPVASGMYIAYINMPDVGGGQGATKILKLAVIQEQEILDIY